MNIYFIYNNGLDHRKICNSGYGASEFQFYMLAIKLSELNYNITIFNKSNINKKIDNINYRPYNNIIDNINIDKNAIVIIMRFFTTLTKLIDIFPPKNLIVWSHDHLLKSHIDNCQFLDNESINVINNNKIKVISVSNFHKKNLSQFIDESNITTIYNILYSDIYKKQPTIEIQQNNIVFASAWAKGLDVIINLFDKLTINHPHFKLILLRPNYDTRNCPDRSYIQLRDTIDNKEEYSILLQSSLCTITSEFPETFGCVFAESYYLNTPVIATHKINGLHEFIDNTHICNLRVYEDFFKLLMQIYNNRPYVNLNEELIDSNGLKQWTNYLENNYQ